MRDPARDFMRGLAVCEMEVVNHSTSLAHAPISSGNLSYADTIMPMFTFISGMSPRGLGSCARLVGLGLAYNAIKSPSTQTIRPFGVLQRLGLAQAVLALAPPTTSLAGFTYPIGLCAVWIAVGIGLAKDPRDPFYPPGSSAQTLIDRWVCSFSPRLAMYKPDYDPEGLLGVLTTATSMWFGRWCVSNALSVEEAIITGISLSSFGYMFAYAYKHTCPISKPFWTLSFTLTTSGISLLKYTLFKLAMPFMPQQLTSVLVCMGQKSLECFFASAVLDRLGFNSFVRGLLRSQFGEPPAEFASGLVSTGVLAAFSWLCVQQNWSLRL